MNDNELQKRAAPVGEYTTWDYRIAPGGDGPLADEWEDKPHRLVYDLCKEIERLRALIPQEPAPTTEPTCWRCSGAKAVTDCGLSDCDIESHAEPCPACRPQETKRPESRWVTLRRTSPSGKTLFLCRSCERVSPTPDKECEHAPVECGGWPSQDGER